MGIGSSKKLAIDNREEKDVNGKKELAIGGNNNWAINNMKSVVNND